MEIWTIQRVLRWTAGKFADKGIESFRLDAEVLIARALGVTRVRLYTDFDKPLDPNELAQVRELVKRRLAGEPVAYIVGEQEFWSLPLVVTPAVLIPRRDTETLVEVAIEKGREIGARRVADIGVGSGAVALALAKELPDAEVLATDVSEEALAVARENARRLGLGARVRFARGDLVEPLEGKWDLIVSNPPYVPTGQLARLPPEVQREPRAALDGGPDGLDVFRRLVPAAAALLREGGYLAVEHGFDQAARVAELFRTVGLTGLALRRDLGGRDRVTVGCRGAVPR